MYGSLFILPFVWKQFKPFSSFVISPSSSYACFIKLMNWVDSKRKKIILQNNTKNDNGKFNRYNENRLKTNKIQTSMLERRYLFEKYRQSSSSILENNFTTMSFSCNDDQIIHNFCVNVPHLVF